MENILFRLYVKAFLGLLLAGGFSSACAEEPPARPEKVLIREINLEHHFSTDRIPCAYISYSPPKLAFDPDKDPEQVRKESSGRLILALWNDGTIVWSNNQITGGEPYFLGKINPERIDELKTRTREDGNFKDRALRVVYMPFDSQFTSMTFIDDSGEFIQVASEHEALESANPGRVYSSRGVLEKEEGDTAIETLRKKDESPYAEQYLRMRIAYDKVKTGLLELIPTNDDNIETVEVNIDTSKTRFVEVSEAKKLLN